MLLGIAFAVGAAGTACSVPQAAHDPHRHSEHAAIAASGGASATLADTRVLVRYPEPLRIHTLANMRDHLVALGEIQAALAGGAFDQASEVAERRLGMSSLELHGAHEVATYMPEGMQQAGTAMHRAASQFATVATNASVSDDLRPVLASLARLNQTCVACHAGYRLQ